MLLKKMRHLPNPFRRWILQFIIRRETKRRGGPHARKKARGVRRFSTHLQKQEILDDLYRSWTLREIKLPTKEEVDFIERMQQRIPWQKLLELKRKYWHENI